MSSFNEQLKKITLKELLLVIIFLFIIHFSFNSLNIVHLNSVWIYIFIIFYFVFKLRGEFSSLGKDISQLFSPNLLLDVLIIVALNIFFSYGMLYLSDHILNIVSPLNLFKSPSFVSGGLLASVIISPISEELIFRGVFLNRLKLIVPTVFAVLVSSLLFASLHGFGAIFSAFVFGICLSILYLKTENIFIVMFAHFLNNLLAEIIVFLDSGNLLFTNSLVIGVMSVMAIVSFAVILTFIVRQFKMIK